MCDIGTNYIKTIKATTLFVVFLFVHSWEQRKAKELCSISTGKSNTQDQVDDGKYPFYIRSDIPVRSNKYLYDCEAVITIGDGNIGRVFHYVNGKFDLHQRCYKMTDFQDIWGKYFFYYFSTKFYERAMKMTAKATVDSVRLEMISEMDIKQPFQISEQKQIAEFFDYLNNLITLHQRKVFSRFLQFSRQNKQSFLPISWEQRKLGNIAAKVTEKNTQNSIKETFTNSAEMGVVSQRDFFDHDIAKADKIDGYYIVQENDFIYNPRISVTAPCGPINRNKLGRKGVMSPLYTIFRTNGINPLFLEWYFKSSCWYAYMYFNGDSGARSDRFSIKNELFFDMPIPLPKDDEQWRIGLLLESLNNLITLHQRECFYIYKKYLLFLELQNSIQMNYSWEQRKLYDIADRFDNLRIPVAANLRIHGITPYYGANGIQDYVSGYTHDGEFVLVAEDGANDLKNYPVNYVKGRIWVNNHAHVLQGKAKLLDNKFLSYLINRADIESLLVGCGRAKLNAETMMNIVFLVPNYEEQIEIGNYLSKIDNLITLHQCESCKKVVAVQSAFARRNLSKWADSWEQRKLGDITQIIMGQSPDGSTYSDFPTDYILVQGNADLENGWVKPRIWTTQKTKYAVAGDLIMSVRAPAGSMGKTAYNVVLGRGVAAIKGNEFIFQVLTKMDLEGFWKKLSAGSTFESLNSDNIINANINLPSNLEQDKIGSIFENIDNLITLHQRKVFSKNIIFKNIKFGGLETKNNISWEQRKFEDAFIERREKTVTENEDTLLSCAINGMFLNSELFGHFRGTTTIGYLKVKKNDLILSAQNLHLGNANVNLRFEHGIISPAYKVYDLNNCEPEFVQAWVKKEDTKNFFLAATTEGASQCRKNIEWDTLGKQTICMPAIKEQATIGSFFKCVDNLITLHQRIKIFFTGDYHDKKNK